MRPIKALAMMLRASWPITPADARDRFGGDVVAMLADSGLIMHGPTVRSVRCELCDGGHSAEISVRGGQLVHDCAYSGVTGTVDPNDVATWAPNVDALSGELRSAIGQFRDDYPDRALIAGAVRRLGHSTLGGREWACILALGALDRQAVEEIRRYSGPPGLVIATRPTLPEIGDHKVIGLGDHFDVSPGGRLVADRALIQTALGVTPHAARSRGRPIVGLEEAKAQLPSMSVERLQLEPREILIQLRAAGIKFAKSWKRGPPPDDLVKKFAPEVDRELQRKLSERND